MADPKVSVCIPVYNCEKYLGEAIESVLAQTYSDFELIIVDNHSTDKSPQIAEKYAKLDKRITCYRNESNLGVISNWNRAVLLGRGEYIKMLHSDDKMGPECLELFVNKLDSCPGISLITSFTQCMGDVDDIKGESDVYATGEIEGKILQKNLMLTGNWIGSPTTVMFCRRDLHIGVFNHAWSKYLPDLDFWIRLLSIGNAYVIPQILIFHRTHNESLSATCNAPLTYVKERLKFTRFAFQFPNIYGEYTKKEQRQRNNHILERMVREGLGRRGLKPKIDMIKTGFSYSRTIFCWLLIKNIHRFFKKSRFSEGNRD